MRFYLKSCGQCGAIMLQLLSSSGIFCCSLNLQHILGSFRFLPFYPHRLCLLFLLYPMCPLVNFRTRQQRPGIFYAASRFFHDYTILYKYNAKKRLLQPKQGQRSCKETLSRFKQFPCCSSQHQLVHPLDMEHMTTQTAKMKPRNLLEHALEIVTLWYGGRLALRGQMDFGELSSAVLVAQNAFDGAR